MFRAISNIVRVGDIRNKVLFTLLMLIIFRVGTFIPVPGVNTSVINFADNSVFGFLNTFGGGALQNFSILTMGIMPYITASIIVQLLQMDVVPKFTEWSKQGEMGRRKLAQVTRYGTVILGFIQAIGMSIGFNVQFPGLITNPGVSSYLLIAIVLTAGTSFLMWLGEQITSHGVGNGISVLIFAGIVARIPLAINEIYAQKITSASNIFLEIVYFLIFLAIILAVIIGTIYIQQGYRKIPIQYAKQTSGRTPYGGETTHLPIKVNAAGVIPVIFAISLLITPRTIAQFFPQNSVTRWITSTFDYTTITGMIIYAVLIIAFTYFYTFVQVNPEQMADNLKKQGGYIPGIRPGKSTEKYITKILYRLTLAGSVFLAIIAVLPMLFVDLANLPANIRIGGTSLLIVTGVALDIMKRIESQLVQRHYRGFIKR